MEEEHAEVYLEGNSYEIEAVDGTLDLNILPGSFDVKKASNWKGATVKDGKFVLEDAKTGTYTYDLGKKFTFLKGFFSGLRL